jgi:hypothetical protein
MQDRGPVVGGCGQRNVGRKRDKCCRWRRQEKRRGKEGKREEKERVTGEKKEGERDLKEKGKDVKKEKFVIFVIE